MSHLSPDELVDAVEGTLAATRQEHSRVCADCARQAAQLAAVLREAQQIAVPEPSPLYWDHFSARVQRAIAVPSEEIGRWQRQARWFALASVGAAIAIVVVLGGSAVRPPADQSPNPVGNTRTADAAPDDLDTLGEQEWQLVSHIVGAIDIDAANDAGILVRPGEIERAALELTAVEQRELVRLLQAEIAKAGG